MITLLPCELHREIKRDLCYFSEDNTYALKDSYFPTYEIHYRAMRATMLEILKTLFHAEKIRRNSV